MTIADANILLRYFLADIQELYERSKEILEHEEIYLPFEVIAEIVYVLEKVYSAGRKDILETLSGLLKYPNIETVDAEVLEAALQCYSDTGLDFVDALLWGYRTAKGYAVYSFDKKLNRLLERN